MFLYYANEESGDVIGGSTKTIQHSRISPEILEHVLQTWHQKRALYITKETGRHLLYCCQGNTLSSNLFL